MPLVRYRPAPPLDTWIECFWWSSREQAQMAPERMLPTGSASLVFSLSDVSFSCWPEDKNDERRLWSRGVLHGPQSTYFHSGPKLPGITAGVALRPGAVAAVMGLPASEVTGRHVPLDDIWGQRAEIMHERLCAAHHPDAVFGVLEEELCARLRQPLLLHPAIAWSLARPIKGPARLRVSDVRNEVDYSARHFVALFRAAVGLTPGQYFRIQRFSAVLRALAGSKARSLADLAVAKGYADQSHLNREFKEFSGTTPLRYRPRDAQSPHHHALEEASPPGVR